MMSRQEGGARAAYHSYFTLAKECSDSGIGDAQELWKRTATMFRSLLEWRSEELESRTTTATTVLGSTIDTLEQNLPLLERTLAESGEEVHERLVQFVVDTLNQVEATTRESDIDLRVAALESASSKILRLRHVLVKIATERAIPTHPPSGQRRFSMYAATSAATEPEPTALQQRLLKVASDLATTATPPTNGPLIKVRESIGQDLRMSTFRRVVRILNSGCQVRAAVGLIAFLVGWTTGYVGSPEPEEPRRIIVPNLDVGRSQSAEVKAAQENNRLLSQNLQDTARQLSGLKEAPQGGGNKPQKPDRGHSKTDLSGDPERPPVVALSNLRLSTRWLHQTHGRLTSLRTFAEREAYVLPVNVPELVAKLSWIAKLTATRGIGQDTDRRCGVEAVRLRPLAEVRLLRSPVGGGDERGFKASATPIISGADFVESFHEWAGRCARFVRRMQWAPGTRCESFSARPAAVTIRGASTSPS